MARVPVHGDLVLPGNVLQVNVLGQPLQLRKVNGLGGQLGSYVTIPI